MKYFSHDLDSRNDDKCFELIEIHGIGGYGFWWVILEELYKSESTGFQIEATKVWLKRLGRSVSIADERIIIRYFDTLADLGLISKQLWQEHIVYSEGVLKRADAYMIKRSNDAERKRVQRSKDAQKTESVTCDIASVTRDISVTLPMSQGVTPTDAYSYSDSNSNSEDLNKKDFFFSAENLENSFPEEKKEPDAVASNPEIQETPPPTPAPLRRADSSKIEYADPMGDRFSQSTRRSQIKPLLDNEAFISYLKRELKCTEYYKARKVTDGTAKNYMRTSYLQNTEGEIRFEQVMDYFTEYQRSQLEATQPTASSDRQPMPERSAVPTHLKNLIQK